MSPSLWYDDHLVLRLEEAYARDHGALPGRIELRPRVGAGVGGRVEVGVLPRHTARVGNAVDAGPGSGSMNTPEWTVSVSMQ